MRINFATAVRAFSTLKTSKYTKQYLSPLGAHDDHAAGAEHERGCAWLTDAKDNRREALILSLSTKMFHPT